MSASGGSTPTLSDVAAAVGLHVSTVSRILNGQAQAGRISSVTEARVRGVAAEMGYRGNMLARALRTGRSYMVGMMMPDLANLYQANITSGVADALRSVGYSLLISSSGNDKRDAESQVRTMIHSQAAGIIYGVATREDPLLQWILDAQIPVVLYNRSTDIANVAAVVPDHAGGMELVLSHLLEWGHRDIATLAAPDDVWSGAVRKSVFNATIQREGAIGRYGVVDELTEEAGRLAALEMLAETPRPTAVVAANDRVALGVIDAIHELGLRCPDDISVVGFNDMPYAARFSPSLTTVRAPQYELGRLAATRLLAQIDGPQSEPQIDVLPVELIVRESTRRLG
jgi:LacI family transcriptional regulator